ncbi:MAG: orotidine-5'-phosphate decarboxylase [bacterium]|nr:orotidine-5'-phosphate decarboxylase [bacterium]
MKDDHFADDLVRCLRRLGHPLCVGLDPHLDRIPALFRTGSMTPRDPRTSAAVERFLKAVVDRVAGRVGIVKPQIAFFECLGWRGLQALEAVVGHARAAGLRILLDAKRGDIGSTAAGYAAAYFGADSALGVDALTVNPYLGGDSLEPFVDRARRGGFGLFVVVRSSNPGAGDLQEQPIAGRGKLYEVVADLLSAPSSAMRGPLTGWSSLGVVVGASSPEASARIRELLPHSLFLVPGYGAQGGGATAAVHGFVAGPGGRLEGGLVSSSRGIVFPEGSHSDAAGWERTIDEAVARATGELAEAVARGR